eukprot:gnl/TRDRNA2_/TRDRNA2_32920_c0_seq1.p1 gnl/TRDRNA2_/TRDRNA2_32920_c0~~gnl/TRDRNA2_/TRDRNA2_32920_c0_seq1.p1  ORF type:complete len:579 (+),score=118.28 gnl/TRDRNA2_/TRDRNA2_32920_c0_seq1:1-1737(+)
MARAQAGSEGNEVIVTELEENKPGTGRQDCGMKTPSLFRAIFGVGGTEDDGYLCMGRNSKGGRTCTLMSAEDQAMAATGAAPIVKQGRAEARSEVQAVPMEGQEMISKKEVRDARTVELHIYDLGRMVGVLNEATMLLAGMGAFHVGLEVYGDEWSYRRCEAPEEGVICTEPRVHPAHVYRRSVNLGKTPLSERDVLARIISMKHAWRGESYDLLTRNCVHFASALALELGVDSVPNWVVSLPDTGAQLRNMWDAVTGSNNASQPIMAKPRQARPLAELAKTDRRWRRLLEDPDRPLAPTDVIGEQYEKYLLDVIVQMEKHDCSFKRAVLFVETNVGYGDAYGVVEATAVSPKPTARKLQVLPLRAELAVSRQLLREAREAQKNSSNTMSMPSAQDLQWQRERLRQALIDVGADPEDPNLDASQPIDDEEERELLRAPVDAQVPQEVIVKIAHKLQVALLKAREFWTTAAVDRDLTVGSRDVSRQMMPEELYPTEELRLSAAHPGGSTPWVPNLKMPVEEQRPAIESDVSNNAVRRDDGFGPVADHTPRATPRQSAPRQSTNDQQWSAFEQHFQDRSK